MVGDEKNKEGKGNCALLMSEDMVTMTEAMDGRGLG